MNDTPTPGQVAYETLVRVGYHEMKGQEDELWQTLRPDLKHAWDAAAQAVLDGWQDQPRTAVAPGAFPPREKRIVCDLIDDAVAYLLYYDRKEDTDFSIAHIHRAFSEGKITIDEATACFRASLTEYLEEGFV